MTIPTNILQQVETYQLSSLALLQNLNCFIYTANTQFKDFQNFEGNLGSSVTFDLPPRYVANQSLVAVFQGSTQRQQTLTVDQAENVSYAFSDQQFIFNVEAYMQRFGKSAVAELSASVEANVATNALTHTYRFFGDGVTPINSYGQLAKAAAFFRNYGSAKNNFKGYLSDIAVPDIVNSGLNQFVMDRNEEAANSWMVGDFDSVAWYRSNLLPIQTAGTVGQTNVTLTVVSIDGTGTILTLSGAAVSDANAIQANDKLQFQDGVAGQTNVRYLTFIGHNVSSNPVQVRAVAQAGSSGGGQVVVTVFPALDSTVGDATQNVNTPIVAGMQLKVLPSHREGLLCSGDALYLAMPRLPNETPYPTANEIDPETGVSMRMYYGSQFGMNNRGFVNDCAWGSTLVDEYSMALIFPL